MRLIEWNRAAAVRLYWTSGGWQLHTPDGVLYLGDCDVPDAVEEFDKAVICAETARAAA